MPSATNPQAYNRYSYVLGNPLLLIDPSGHCAGDPNNHDPFREDGSIVYDCTIENFQAMSISVRIAWLLAFMQQSIDKKADQWFNNIWGIMESYIVFELAETGSWLSMVNAGILHSIQDGYAMSQLGLERDPGSFGFGAANKWRAFFDGLYSSQPISDKTLISLWGTAEKAGTDYGTDYADALGKSKDTIFETFFVWIGNVYRNAAEANGGMGSTFGSLFGWPGGLIHFEDAVLSLSLDPIMMGVQEGYNTGYIVGESFNDPRSLWGGHSPVYWFTSMVLWAPQETLLLGRMLD